MPTTHRQSAAGRSRLGRPALIALAVASCAPAAAEAAFLTPTGWSRSSPYTTRHEWNIFSTPAGPNAPDVANFPTTWPAPATGLPAANAYDTSGGSFVTSGGNIYSPAAATRIDVDVPQYDAGAGYATTVLLQVRTQGTEPIHVGVDGVRLTYPGGGGTTLYPVEQAELSRVALGGFGGSLVDHAYLFRVPAGPASFKVEIDAAGSSMSLDAVAVDAVTTRAAADSLLLDGMNRAVGFVAQPVPEPAAAGVVGAAAAGLLARRPRRREG